MGRRVAGLDGGNAREGARGDLHAPGPQGVLQLPGVTQVIAEYRLPEHLRSRVIGDGTLLRTIADAVKTRGATAVKNQAGVDRPVGFPQPPLLELVVELALDALLDARNDRPLLVLGRVLEHAKVATDTKIGVTQQIRGDDAGDFVLIVGVQPGRQHT